MNEHPEPPRCGNCFYSTISGSHLGYLLCRRYPPSFPRETVVSEDRFPHVAPTNVCGEFASPPVLLGGRR